MCGTGGIPERLFDYDIISHTSVFIVNFRIRELVKNPNNKDKRLDL